LVAIFNFDVDNLQPQKKKRKPAAAAVQALLTRSAEATANAEKTAAAELSRNVAVWLK